MYVADMDKLEFLKELFRELQVEEYLWLITIFATCAVTIVKIADYWASNSRSKADNKHHNFNATLDGLKSDSETERITSAILLRRYISDVGLWRKVLRKSTTYKRDALNIISSLLRITPCGEFQKALADSISFTNSIKNQDFQYANLQNAIIKLPNNKCISLSNADFFKADLSYASINNAKFQKSAFFGCNMRKTTFRNCDLRNCDLRSTNLTEVRFLDGTMSKLAGARFAGAINIPQDILIHLDKDGVYRNVIPQEKYDVLKTNKSIFISCLGNLSPHQTEYINALVSEIRRLEFNPIFFPRDSYRNSGQISVIQSNIAEADGVIIVGLKNIQIKKGVYRPKSSDKANLSNIWLSSPWNHIEAGIASALGKPILIIHQAELTEGVFDKNINDSRITHIDAKTTSGEFKSNIQKWVQENL